MHTKFWLVRKRSPGRPRHRWENNVSMDLRESGWEGVDLMLLAYDRNHWWALLNMVMNFWVP